MNDVVRRVEVTGKSSGLENLKTKLKGVAQAQDGVAVSADQMSRAQGSVDSRLNRLQRSLDPNYRASRALEAAQRTLNQSLDQGAISVERHAALMELAENKYTANTVAARANAMATNAVSAASRAAAINQRMLFPQLLQIGQAVPLAFQSPLTFMQQFAFQSADIAQIYAGRGGVTAAIRDSAAMVGRFTARLGPLAVATGLVGAGFVGLRDDIRETTGETVSLGNVMRATLDEISSGIGARAAPAIAWLKEDFGKLSTAIIEDVRVVGDTIINGFEASYNTVAATWNRLPELFGYLMYSAADKALDGLNQLIQMGLNDINVLIRAYNQIPVLSDIEELGPFDGLSVDNPFSDGIGADLNQIVTDAFSDSPMTEAFERIGIGAAALAREANAAADGTGNLARAAADAGRPLDLMGRSISAANDNARTWASTLSGNLGAFNSTLQRTGSFFEAAETAGLNMLQSISQKLIDMASQNLVGAVFGALSGLGGLGRSGSSFNSVSWLQNLPSYEGGGFTGHGPRSGGLDGRGGFLAINHPNETMIDHARGQRTRTAANSNINMSVAIDGSVSRAEAEEIAQAMANRLRQEFPETVVNTMTEYRKYGGAV